MRKNVAQKTQTAHKEKKNRICIIFGSRPLHFLRIYGYGEREKGPSREYKFVVFRFTTFLVKKIWPEIKAFQKICFNSYFPKRSREIAVAGSRLRLNMELLKRKCLRPNSRAERSGKRTTNYEQKGKMIGNQSMRIVAQFSRQIIRRHDRIFVS